MSSKARIDFEARDNATQVFNRVQQSMGELDKRAGALSSGFAGITRAFGVTSLAGAGLATALAASIRNTAEFNDAMGKAAQRAGVTSEAMSELAYAAKLSDVSTEELSRGLRRLGDEAQKNSEAFQALGISARDSAGNLRTSDQLFALVAERFAAMPDGIEKTNMAIRLFGDRLGPQLIPLLNSGAQGLKDMGDEARRFGQVVTDDAAKAAAEFNDNLTRLQTSLSGIIRDISGPLIQALAKATTEFLNASRAGDSFWGSMERALRGGIVGQRSSIERAAQDIERLAAVKERADLALSRNPTDLRAQYNAEMAAAELQAALKNYLALAEELQRPILTPQQPTGGGGTGGTGGGGNGRNAPARISEAQRYLQSLQRQLEAMDDLTARETLLRDISMGRLGQVNAAQREQLLAIADTIDLRRQEEDMDRERLAIREMVRQAVIDEAAAVDAANASWEALLQSLVADTTLEKTRRLNEQIQVLDEALKIGRISAEQYAEAMEKLVGVVPELEKTNNLVDQLGLTFTSSFEEAITQGKALGDVLKGLEQDIIRIITRKLMTEPLGNFITGAIGNILPAGLRSFDGGGFTGAGARTGGLDGRGGYLAMLHPNETVLDHTKGQRLGGNVQNINITVPMPSNGRRETAMQFGRDVARQLQMASMRNG